MAWRRPLGPSSALEVSDARFSRPRIVPSTGTVLKHVPTCGTGIGTVRVTAPNFVSGERNSWNTGDDHGHLGPVQQRWFTD
jgi:hypothetical protein